MTTDFFRAWDGWIAEPKKGEEPWLDEIVDSRGAFVTGTDTGVGKTVLMAMLATALRPYGFPVGVFKPISTGGDESVDARWLKEVLELPDPLSRIAPVHFAMAASPLIAAQAERRKIPWNILWRAYDELMKKYFIVLVEGIGGVRVPLDAKTDVRGLIKDFDLPAIVVARAGVGTINHTLLTLDALRQKKIEVIGVILNGATGQDETERTNARVIEETSGVRVLEIVSQMPAKGLPTS